MMRVYDAFSVQQSSTPSAAEISKEVAQQMQQDLQAARQQQQQAIQDMKAAQQNGGGRGSIVIQTPNGPIVVNTGGARPGLPGMTQPGFNFPGGNGRGPVIPMQAVEIVAILGVTLVSCVVGYPLARAVARWIDRRGNAPAVPREVSARLEAIEHAVDSVALEVERISEGQRFTTRLLSERSHEPARDFAAAERDKVELAASPANARRN